MSIPLNFNPLGFTSAAVEPSELPDGYTSLAFLRGTGLQQYIDSGVPMQVGMGTRITFSEFTGGYLAGVYGRNDYQRLYSWFVNSSTSYGWAYGGSWRSASFGTYPSGTVETNYLDNGFLYLKDSNSIVFQEEIPASAEPQATAYTLAIFCRQFNTVGYVHWATANIHSMQISVGEDVVRDYAPAVDPTGTPGLFDKVTQAFLSSDGGVAFVAGIETLKQLQQLAANLPSVTGSPEIKLSLPGEWNGDASANAQLSIISGKGWRATITYRDVETSTSSSFVLGNRGDGGSALVLWCRAVESEHGNYQDADGVRYYVETCHDIWHPQELSPDDLGYTAVLTLEDYLTERGLTAVVYEEDENFTTN